MFRRLRLCDAFEHLATPEEWRWFGPMIARQATHYGVDGWPQFEMWQLQAYDRLLRNLEIKALEKLQSGAWLAEGISRSYGPTLVEIDTALWEYMDIEHRLEAAKGAGFHFIALTVTEAQPKRVVPSQTEQPRLRRQLADWIRVQVLSSKEPIRRADLLKEARLAFEGRNITENMYRNARQDAELPRRSVFRGRPKA
jgi:hypothetical protein